MNEPFLQRYSRTILLNEVGYEGQLKISAFHVIIIGSGGLSSSILPIISAAGVGKITIWEQDKLELSNLQRQFIYKEKDLNLSKAKLAQSFIVRLNSNIQVEFIEKFLTDQTYDDFIVQASKADAIIDASDNFSCRILSNKASILLKKPLFTGACIGFSGHVYSFFANNDFPCYACIFGMEMGYVEKNSCGNSGVFPPLPSIVGSLIAYNVLSFAANNKCDFLKFILVDFLQKTYFKEIKMVKDVKCPACN